MQPPELLEVEPPAAQPPPPSGRRHTLWVRARRSQTGPLLVALLLLGVVFTLSSPYFLAYTNILNIGRQIAITLIVALGVTVVLIAREIDISMAGVMGVCSVTAGIVLHSGSGTAGLGTSLLAAGACLAIGTLFGLFNGLVTVVGKVPSFIVTLGTLSIGGGLALAYNNGEPQAVQSTAFIRLFATGDVGPLPALLVYPIVVLVAVILLLRRTLFGIQVYATGGNPEASRLAGVPVGRVRITALALSGCLAGLAATVATARVQSGLPNIATGIELDAIAAAVLGGTRLSGGFGTAVGTLLGAILIGVVSNGLTLIGVASPVQSVIKGCVIIAAVVLDRLRQNQPR